MALMAGLGTEMGSTLGRFGVRLTFSHPLLACSNRLGSSRTRAFFCNVDGLLRLGKSYPSSRPQRHGPDADGYLHIGIT